MAETPAGFFTISEISGLPGLPNSKSGLFYLRKRESWDSFGQRRPSGKGLMYPVELLPPEAQAALLLKRGPGTGVSSGSPLSPQDVEVAEASTPHNTVCPSLNESGCDSETLPSSPPAGRTPPAGGSFSPETALAQVENPQAESLWDQADRCPGRLKDQAMRRMKILAQVEGLVRLGIGRDVAIRSVSDQVLESRATIYRWWALVKGQPRSEWYPRLMPGDSAGGRRVDVDPSVWAAFKADYLRMEAPAASACYERLQRIAEAKFWTVPSLKTLLRKIEREIHPDVLTLTRIGPHALKRSYPAQERDHSVFTALEAVNADGHKFDVFVEWPDGSKHRPIGLFWQDIYSGKILSWDIDKTENKDMVRVSFGRMVEKYGIPTYAYLDNGHAFTSKFISGGTTNRFRFKILDEDPVGCITACGTQINWATPYWGQAKPIERAFRDFCEHIAKHPECSGAYTGNSPSNKPENYGSRVVPLERFMAVMVREIAAHNARVGRRSKVCSGRSFDQVFKESYAKSMIPRASLSQRRMWLLAADKVTASRQDGAISFLGNRYWHRDLAMHRGERLVLRFETENLHGSVWVYDLANRLVCEAPCMEAAGFDSQEAAREHNRARNALIRLTKKVRDLELQLTAADLVQLLPDDLEEAPVPMPAAIGLAVGGGPSFPSRAEDQGTYEEMTERFSQSLELLKQAKATDPDFKY